MDPCLRVETVIPPHHDAPDTYDAIPPVSVRTAAPELDGGSGCGVTWDWTATVIRMISPSKGESKTALPQSQIDVSNTHNLSALVSSSDDFLI